MEWWSFCQKLRKKLRKPEKFFAYAILSLIALARVGGLRSPEKYCLYGKEQAAVKMKSALLKRPRRALKAKPHLVKDC